VASSGEEEVEDDDWMLYRRVKITGRQHVRAARPAEVAAGGRGHAWKAFEARRRRREVAPCLWR
jgi:hypothetical protein